MKRYRTLLASLIVLFALGGLSSQDTTKTAPARADEQAELKTLKEKVSYAYGMLMGKQLKSQGIELDLNIFARAFQDAHAGSKTALTDAEAKEALMANQKELMSKRDERSKASGDKNRKEGEAFLAENKTKPGVLALPSGLQYKVITAGTGPKPIADDTVTTHYRGTLINGTEFDSSYKRNEPTSFPVKGVIRGWTEALQLMPVGSKWQLFIPSDLAYGERGAGNDIGPNATLIFEIELIAIEKK